MGDKANNRPAPWSEYYVSIIHRHTILISMTRLRILFLLGLLFVAVAGRAGQPINNDDRVARSLVYTYISEQATVGTRHRPFFVAGDFNGDGLRDLAVLFTPHKPPDPAHHITVIHPWPKLTPTPHGHYTTCLAIFNNHKRGDWLSVPPDTFVLLDDSGALETPSFALQQLSPIDAGYTQQMKSVGGKSGADLLVLHSTPEQDHVLSWNGSAYQLH